MPEFCFSLEAYSAFIHANPSDRDGIYRKIMHEIPRFLMAVRPARRAGILSAAPSLTGTRWDALLAGVAEHLAGIHALPVPRWCDEPGRFVDPVWIVCPIVAERAGFAPPAFHRHGALPDPMDLDERGGEPTAFRPGP